MGERGFDDVTVEEIAAQCGVSTRTVFRHFETKDDLVVARLFGYISLLREFVRRALAEGDLPLVAVARAARGLAAVIDAEGDRARLIMRLMYSCRTLRARAFDLERAWEATVAMELTHAGVDEFAARILAAIGLSVFSTPTRDWAEADEATQLVPLVDATAEAGLGIVLV